MRLHEFVSFVAAVSLGSLVAATSLWAADATAAKSARPGKPAQADNSLCYVCHLTLQNEQITASHMAEGIGCANCHGTSSDHMHDEMLTSKPDMLYGRKQVAAMCSKCHEKPHEDKTREMRAFLDKWRGHDRPNGRVITDASICTDCHGTHVLAKRTEVAREKPAQWIPLFDGRSLSGWKASAADLWRVERGRLQATVRPGQPASDLWTAASQGDFRLSVTFRCEGPLKAGIWLRGQPAAPGPRVEVIPSAGKAAACGSVYVPGKGVVLINAQEDLFDAEGWNTIVAEVRGQQVSVALNGQAIGSVVVAGAAQGRIGFHMEGSPGSTEVQWIVREVLLQKLSSKE